LIIESGERVPYLDSIRVFVRVVELGSITAAGRDQRLTPAVASNRIKELEQRLGVRLFNRTTRKLSTTEIGQNYYVYAQEIIETINRSEAAIAGYSQKPKGVISITAPLGSGRRIIAPLIPEFYDKYPEIEVRLRLSDRPVDMLAEGIDVAFVLGNLVDSNMKLRLIVNCPRVLCAAPSYFEAHGVPQTANALIENRHRCLLLRFPGSREYYWTLETEEGPRKFNVLGPYDADDGDVLIEWALAGRGIINKPFFEVAPYIASGELTPVLQSTPPSSSRFACLYPHRRMQDPKIRLFLDFMIERCRKSVNDLLANAKSGP